MTSCNNRYTCSCVGVAKHFISSEHNCLLSAAHIGTFLFIDRVIRKTSKVVIYWPVPLFYRWLCSMCLCETTALFGFIVAMRFNVLHMSHLFIYCVFGLTGAARKTLSRRFALNRYNDLRRRVSLSHPTRPYILIVLCKNDKVRKHSQCGVW